jgi:hypothetical protein
MVGSRAVFSEPINRVRPTFQIATSLALLMTVEELRPEIEARPSGQLATSLVREYPGHSAGVLPDEWLAEAGLRQPSAAS